MVHKHTRNLGDAFFLGGNKTTMTSNNAKVTVDNDGMRVDNELAESTASELTKPYD